MNAWLSSRKSALVLIVLCAFCGCTKAQDSQKTKTYAVPDCGYKFKAPVTWEPREKNSPITRTLLTVDGPQVAGTMLQTLVIVVPDSKVGDDSLAAQVKEVKGVILKNDPKAVVSDNEDATLDGSKALRFSYSMISKGMDTKGFRVITIHHGKLYLIGFYCDPSLYAAKVAEINKAIDTWKWTD